MTSLPARRSSQVIAADYAPVNATVTDDTVATVTPDTEPTVDTPLGGGGKRSSGKQIAEAGDRSAPTNRKHVRLVDGKYVA